VRLLAWLIIGLVIYFPVRQAAQSTLGKELRGEISAHGIFAGGGAWRTETRSHERPPRRNKLPATKPGNDREDAGLQSAALGPFDVTMLVIGHNDRLGHLRHLRGDCPRRRLGGMADGPSGALAGVMTILGALSYAETGRRHGRTPAASMFFLREAYSPMWGFLYGWTCFLVIQTGSIARRPPSSLPSTWACSCRPSGPTTRFFASPTSTGSSTCPSRCPFLSDEQGNALPFFEMKHFTVSAGQLVAVGVIAFPHLAQLSRAWQEGKFVQNLMTVAKTPRAESCSSSLVCSWSAAPRPG